MAGMLRIVDVTTGNGILAKEIAKPVTSVAFSPDGRWVAAVGGEIRVFDASNGREVATPEHRYHPSCAAFSLDGKTLATSSGEIKLWDVGTWKQRDEYKPSGSHEFRSIAWSPDGKSIAVAGARSVFLWTPTQ
jgi:WD40 repeat protein